MVLRREQIHASAGSIAPGSHQGSCLLIRRPGFKISVLHPVFSLQIHRIQIHSIRRQVNPVSHKEDGAVSCCA